VGNDSAEKHIPSPAQQQTNNDKARIISQKPNSVRREARKLNTQAMHERWQREYRRLKKSRAGMSGVWYSQQIAKSAVGDGRSAETIRKHMTK
jgi:hypothetical protein